MSLLFTNKEQEGLVLTQLHKMIERHVTGGVTFAYMPANEAKKKRYKDAWKKFCQDHSYRFVHIDNSLDFDDSGEERSKLRQANVLLITGGNTYELMRNLRRSGLDKEIKDFAKREDTVIAAFSAGAIALSPSLRILEHAWHELVDTNKVGLRDMSGLGIIKEEVFPHYTDEDKKDLEKYKRDLGTEVLALREHEFLVV